MNRPTPGSLGRSDRKRNSIVAAATAVFLEKGYDGASMDDVATRASVSKPTIYKHFGDKRRLFAAIVQAATGQVDELVERSGARLMESDHLEQDLFDVALEFLTVMMQSPVLRFRRLVIANADRFPALTTQWYEQGFQPALAALATCFEHLASRGVLRELDGGMAANHFAALLFWVPMNKAMFTSDPGASTPADLAQYARSAVTAFIAAYGAPEQHR